MQIYKDMDIGTAKPTIEEREGIHHHMIDIVEPEFEYTAGLYKTEANKKIQEILSKGKTPIIVGGTGLYIDILLKNFELRFYHNQIVLYPKTCVPFCPSLDFRINNIHRIR